MSASNVDHWAKMVWEYHLLYQRLKKAEAILVLCSNDIRVAEYAINLFQKGYGSLIIFSGNEGVLTKALFDKPEAEIFADIARKRGVSERYILIENQSRNTGENVLFTRRMLEEKGRDFSSFLLVQKPCMERRSYATFKKLWPEKEVTVTSPPIKYEDYPNGVISKDLFINVMVGDLQRIKLYPEKGFQIPQVIPAEVWEAYEKLVEMGYTKHLIKESF